MSRPPLAELRRKEPYLRVALAVLVLDQITKWLVETRLAGRGAVTVIPGLLDFTHVRNTGVAFGLFAAEGSLGGTILLTLLGLAGFSLLAYYFIGTPRDHRLMLSSLALVLGGAIGNLADRIARGAVTDFVDFYWGSYHWYTFNVADSAITVGVLLMTVELLVPGPETGRKAARESSPAATDGT